jgi:aspartate/methionine/tyrosine aminotransferase
MKETPISYSIVEQKIRESGIPDLGKASIRELVKLVNQIESATKEKYIRMEMGVPGLSPSTIGMNAEIEALKQGVAAIYPMIEGNEALKNESSRFAKLFLDIDIDPAGCIPTVGSMQGACASFMMTGRRDPVKNTTLFIDPGFPVQKQQHKVLGLPYLGFDVYDYRGEKLKAKLESYLERGNISAILYSNPNNPAWFCFTDDELIIIAELARKYDVIIIEDLAYFAMDFRHDYSVPGKPPYQPTIAKYVDDYILLVSSSKAFSYAGQRISMLMVSNHLFNREFPFLKNYYSSSLFGRALIYGALYALSAGTAHTAQYALAAMLKAANDGTFDFVEQVKEYGRKAAIMKKLFTDSGFHIVYDRDIDQPLADGFYFTISYPGYSGSGLLRELLFYGISAITLDITGSDHSEGLRACVSQVQPAQFDTLQQRLREFHQNHMPDGS